MTEGTRRPIGVTILGILVVLGGIIIGLAGLGALIVGFASLIPGVDLPTSTLFIGGFLYIILAIILLVSGAGLLKLRPWAWTLALIATLATIGWSGYRIYDAGIAGVPSGSIIAVIVGAVILVYLLLVRKHFGGRSKEDKARAEAA